MESKRLSPICDGCLVGRSEIPHPQAGYGCNSLEELPAHNRDVRASVNYALAGNTLRNNSSMLDTAASILNLNKAGLVV